MSNDDINFIVPFVFTKQHSYIYVPKEIIYHSTRDNLCSIPFMYIFHIVRAQTSAVQAISFIDVLLPIVRLRFSRELLNNALKNTLRFASPIPLLILLALWASPVGYTLCKTTSVPHKLAGILADVKQNDGVPISKELKVKTYFRNP